MNKIPVPFPFTNDDTNKIAVGTLLGLVAEIYGRLYDAADDGDDDQPLSPTSRLELLRKALLEATRHFDPELRARVEAATDDIAAALFGMEVHKF